MANQRQVPGYGNLEETSSNQASVPGFFNANESASTSVTTTLTWTEANDTNALVADVAGAMSAALAWTEANDTTAGVISVGTGAAMSWTESADTTAIVGTVSTPTLTTDPIKNNTTGLIYASVSGFTVEVLLHSTMAPVKNFTSKTTDSSGVMQIVDAIFTVGTVYVVVIRDSTGDLACEKYTAA